MDSYENQKFNGNYCFLYLKGREALFNFQYFLVLNHVQFIQSVAVYQLSAPFN